MTVERPIRIEDYLDETGNSPFHRWFNGLNKEAAAKVVAALTRMENGNLCNVKSVGKGVHEYRVNFGPGYRVYFGWDGPTLVILLSGGTKARQQADSLKLKKGGNDTGRATEERLKPQPRGSLQEDRDMALTRDFKETVRARIDSDPGFKAQFSRKPLSA
jgi:putative addiction module killer protein